jgi:4-hydroxy-tetrahydrodipicolinate synthase
MFHGSLVALVTPMLEDGAVDYDAFDQLLAWHLEQGTDGVVVLGTTGESATITADERKKIIQLALARLKGKLPCIVGTGANATSHALSLTQQAMELGADGALLVTPYYNKPPQSGLYEHFKLIAHSVAIPQILYNVPSRTGCDLLPETVNRLSGISNIVALKEATGDIKRLHAIMATGCDINLLSGDDATAVEFMLAGGKGSVTVAANIVPKEYKMLCDAALKGEKDKALRLHESLQGLFRALFVESNPIPTKWLLAQMGSIQGGIRLPLTALDQRYYAEVKAAAVQAGIEL